MRFPKHLIFLALPFAAPASTITSAAYCSTDSGPSFSGVSSCASETTKPADEPWNSYTAGGATASATTAAVFGLSTLDVQMDLAASAVRGQWGDPDLGTGIIADSTGYASASFTISGYTDGPVREGTFYFVFSSAGSIPAPAQAGQPPAMPLHTLSSLLFTGIPPETSYTCTSDSVGGCLVSGPGNLTLGQPFLISMSGFAQMSTLTDAGGYAFHSSALHLEFREVDGSPAPWHQTAAVAEPATWTLLTAGLSLAAAAKLRRRG